ncbi:MAG: SIR2 family protein [Oscillospiraceae bacterium]|nr:SIR2 family protein [Oscillospiraceae bacterium]
MILGADVGFDELSKLLASKQLSIFAGSGISVESGLPAWDGFIDKYIEICQILNKCLPPDLRFDGIIDDAKDSYRNKNLIDTVTALKEKIKYCKENGVNVDFCDDILNELFYSAKCNQYHEMIVSTSYNHIITTNYDTLLEDAAKKLGYYKLLTSSYSFQDYQDISAAIYSGNTAIIHAHGKIADLKLDEFVLTKQDYLNIMKHNPGFRYIINTIFITNSVLFVGYGGSDPHFEDIIDDLNLTLNWSGNNPHLPKCYIMMIKDKATPIREFLNDSNRIDIIAFNTYEEMKDFLDRICKAFPRAK